GGRTLAGAGGEIGDDELVHRQREGEERAGQNPWEDAGSVTRRKVVTSPAPRSMLASTIEKSKLRSRVRTTAQTNAMLNTTWLMMIECRP
ncbi:hypothetical protein R0J87_20650, partial [Halomonas sp. SIMBA_159]